MGLSTVAKAAMLITAVDFFKNAYLYKSGAGTPAVDLTLGSADVINRFIAQPKPLSWSYSANSISTINSTTFNPINYAIILNTQLTGILLTDNNATEGSRVIFAIIPLKTPIPAYTSGDGAYYVRNFTFTLNEV